MSSDISAALLNFQSSQAGFEAAATRHAALTQESINAVEQAKRAARLVNRCCEELDSLLTITRPDHGDLNDIVTTSQKMTALINQSNQAEETVAQLSNQISSLPNLDDLRRGVVRAAIRLRESRDEESITTVYLRDGSIQHTRNGLIMCTNLGETTHLYGHKVFHLAKINRCAAALLISVEAGELAYYWLSPEDKRPAEIISRQTSPAPRAAANAVTCTPGDPGELVVKTSRLGQPDTTTVRLKM